jgi:mono/diheme cytochrome c family protein
MRRLFLPSIYLAAAATALAAPDLTPAGFIKTVRPLFDDHCYDCHGDGEHKGDFALDKLTLDFSSPDKLAAWVKVFDQIETGEMPPKKKARPAAAAKAAALDWLRTALTAVDSRRQQTEGRVVARRLNRTEYENTIRDLLAIETPLKEILPEDNSAHGFDNIGAALDVSTVLMERYLEAADAALDAAMPRGQRFEPKTERYTYLDDEGLLKTLGDKSVLARPDGVVMFSDGYMPTQLKKFKAPTDGFYKVRASIYTYQPGKQPLMMVALGGDVITGRGETHTIGYFDAPTDKPTVIEFTDRLAKGHTFKLMPFRMPRDDYQIRQAGSGNYKGPGLAVQWVEVEGPLAMVWPPESHRRLFGDLPIEPVDEKDAANLERAKKDPSKAAYLYTQIKQEVKSPDATNDAERLLRGFIPEAFRRPVSEADMAPFISLVKARLDSGYRFEQAMRVGYKAVLTSPEFLYLREKPGQLDDHALASRLSYFLWSTKPDGELQALAQQGKLRQPAVLRAQTERLLASPKARAFTENFLGQWLDLRQIDFTTPDKKLYPEFDELLKVSMVRETQLFFEEVLKHDLPVQNFIHSDFTMLNGRLAEHYEIPRVTGQEFRRVTLPPDAHRGGLLGQGAILKVTANGTTTSPVLRGKWILDRVMGVPPAPPPKNVAAVEPDIRGTKTIREQLDKHRDVETCASCHVKIDPPGFALESFDVIGGWRERYRIVPDKGQKADYVTLKTESVRPLRVALGPPVEASYTLESGEAFRNVDEFKALLLRDKELMARCLAAKLLTYGTGAGVQFADRPVMAEIVARSKAKNYGLRTLIHEVVQSKTFQIK